MKQKPSPPTIDEVMEGIKRICEEEWFYTGSYAFGCMGKESDIDIVVPIMDRDTLWGSFEPYKPYITDSNYFSGVFILTEEGTKLNIIPLHPVAFMSWAYATEFMTRYVRSSEDLSVVVDRNLRHGIFEMLVGVSHLVVGGVGAKELPRRFKIFKGE